MKQFTHIDTWVFDLDNTLYDAHLGAFEDMGRRMSEYVAKVLNIDFEAANRIRKHYYHTYGTSLQGLIKEHNIDPQPYLDYVHNIDLGNIPVCTLTSERLSKLPGRKIIYTNGSRKHAERITRHMGIDHLFEDMFGIEEAGFRNKPDPEPYQDFIKRYGITPDTTCMLEDMHINLKPAASLGMTTLWLHGENDDLQDGDDHIHHRAPKLTTWLEDLFNDNPHG